jgi:dihydrofolate reductase
MTTSLIVAVASNGVIGARGALPWYLSDDLRRFRRLTSGHPVIVGRLTHESIVARLGRTLPGRTSVVLSSREPAPAPADGADGAAAGAAEGAVIWVSSLDKALAAAHEAEAGTRPDGSEGEVFVAGGASVYLQSLPHADRVYLTRVHRDVEGDTSLPPGWLEGFTLVAREDRPASGTDPAFSWLDYLREQA